MASTALLTYRLALLAALPLAAPWLLVTARLRGKSRPTLTSRMWTKPPALPQGGIWVQAVSVGEVGVARSLLREIRKRSPELPLVLSATTATGLATATGTQSADAVVPFPLDFPGPVRRALDAARPRLVMLVETELWPELLAACEQRRVPVILANARISDRSFAGYRRLRRLFLPLLRPLSLVLAQSDQDADRLVALGVPRDKVKVVGNVKFDLAPGRELPAVSERIRAVAAGRPILVAGSTMAGEEEIVLEALARLQATSRPLLLLAPRHPERARHVAGLASENGFAVVLRSRLDEEARPADVVVLDTIGELAGLYSVASAAFIGGSLVPKGGHNPIEPARFGVPIVTGPHVRNFAAVYAEFLERNAARVVRDAADLARTIETWLADPSTAASVGREGSALLARNAGATARVVDAIEPFLQ